MTFNETTVEGIINLSNGYPYFIQFICRELFDVFIQKISAGESNPVGSWEDILRKLDGDVFAGRWSRATDRQRELLTLISELENCDEEFTVQEIVDMSKVVPTKPFSSSHVNQMLSKLAEAGLVYKNRFGKYSFAVPPVRSVYQETKGRAER